MFGRHSIYRHSSFALFYERLSLSAFDALSAESGYNHSDDITSYFQLPGRWTRPKFPKPNQFLNITAMNDNEVKTVQMTAEEAAQYAAFKAEQERKAAADKARKDRKVYGQMVDEEIEQALPMLRELSGDIRTVKEQVLDNFRQILDMKADVLKRTKDGQKSHTFTNSTGDKRITIGRCVVDGWRDTVEDGIAIVKEAVMGLIKDDETKAMINQIMRLIARDQNGNLKASKVLQLDTLAEELHNERLNEGIAIIKESYIPNLSKTYIRAEWKDDNGVWRYVPLGMTEA
nr:MAG TPA: Protein of unknown function (DUF3164) [Caudoviricetes sp.]